MISLIMLMASCDTDAVSVASNYQSHVVLIPVVLMKEI